MIRRKPSPAACVVRGVVNRVLTCALALGCGTQVIDHDATPGAPPLLEPTATTTAPATSGASFGTDGFGSSTTGFGLGNYPDPAVSLCGALPPGVPEATGLTSAFAVRALAGATDEADNEVEAGTVRVRLSSQALFDCGEAFDLDYGCGTDPSCPWGVALSLGTDEQLAGVYSISDLAAPHYEVAVPGPGDAVEDAEGTIELFRVTPDCIVGELRDVPGRNGGFVAVVCQSQCVPMPGEGC